MHECFIGIPKFHGSVVLDLIPHNACSYISDSVWVFQKKEAKEEYNDCVGE